MSNGKEKDQIEIEPKPGTIPKRVKFVFEYGKNYGSIYVNGVYGGVTPSNEIRMELFAEFPRQPNIITQKVNENGSIGGVISIEPKLDTEEMEYVRTLLTGVTMRVETAQSMAKWLTEKVKEAKGEK